MSLALTREYSRWQEAGLMLAFVVLAFLAALVALGLRPPRVLALRMDDGQHGKPRGRQRQGQRQGPAADGQRQGSALDATEIELQAHHDEQRGEPRPPPQSSADGVGRDESEHLGADNDPQDDLQDRGRHPHPDRDLGQEYRTHCDCRDDQSRLIGHDGTLLLASRLKARDNTVTQTRVLI